MRTRSMSTEEGYLVRKSKELLSSLVEEADRDAFLILCSDLLDSSIPFLPSPGPSIVDNALKKFHEVFRNRYRHSPHYLPQRVLQATLATAREDAFSALGEFTGSRSWTRCAVKEAKAELKARLDVERAWICEINKWKECQYFQVITTETILIFKSDLKRIFPFDNGRFYDEAEIKGRIKKLITIAVYNFDKGIPRRDEDEGPGVEDFIRTELRWSLTMAAKNALQKNRLVWKIRSTLDRYKNHMANFVDHRMHPINKLKTLKEYHLMLKTKYDKRLSEIKYDAFLKNLWETKVAQNYRKHVAEWRLNDAFKMKLIPVVYIKKEPEEVNSD